MENSEINDCPPANVIEEKEKNDYPIIRCEDCHEILAINLKLDKKEVQLKCEKEGKIKNIPFDKFFSEIKKYEEINCCQFCKNKNPSQKYYLCKTCSNKILCEKCFEGHNKKDDIIKIKIDSTCKKHYNPYESYCPICKENKCSYCSINHDESHEKDEILFKKKLLKQNKLDRFKIILKVIIKEKIKIEQQINSVVKELQEKIEFINNLKDTFNECLNMKLKFVELVLNNYEQKIKDFDANFFTIDNLEKQINFNLYKLEFNNNDSLDKKIENVTNCLNKNLSSHFNVYDNEQKLENENLENLFDEDITKVEYKNLTEISYKASGFLDFNKDLFVFYSTNTIYFLAKNDYKTKINIDEYGLEGIIMCKKVNDKQILICTYKNIIFIDIINYF